MNKKNLFKIFTFLIFVLSFSFLIFNFALAGIVPCGTSEYPEPCTPCHFFLAFKNIFDFIITYLAPPVAGLMFLIGGIILLTAGGSEEGRARGKKVFTSTVIGLVIIYTAWLLIDSLIIMIAKNVEGYVPAEWWQVQCK